MSCYDESCNGLLYRLLKEIHTVNIVIFAQYKSLPQGLRCAKI